MLINKIVESKFQYLSDVIECRLKNNFRIKTAAPISLDVIGVCIFGNFTYGCFYKSTNGNIMVATLDANAFEKSHYTVKIGSIVPSIILNEDIGDINEFVDRWNDTSILVKCILAFAPVVYNNDYGTTGYIDLDQIKIK